MAWGLSYVQDTFWLQKEMMGSKTVGAKYLSAGGLMTFGPQSCKEWIKSPVASWRKRHMNWGRPQW